MVRKVREDDAERLAEIYRPYVEKTCFSFENEAPDAEEMKRRIKKITAFRPWYVYEENGIVMGYAYASPFRERPGYLISSDVSIYVDQGIRGRGIGRKLYERLFDTARKQGIVKLFAVVIDSNPASAAFHERMGFVLQSHFRKIGFKKGDYWGMYYMRKDLVSDEDLPPVPQVPVSWLEVDKGE